MTGDRSRRGVLDQVPKVKSLGGDLGSIIDTYIGRMMERREREDSRTKRGKRRRDLITVRMHIGKNNIKLSTGEDGPTEYHRGKIPRWNLIMSLLVSATDLLGHRSVDGIDGSIEMDRRTVQFKLR